MTRSELRQRFAERAAQYAVERAMVDGAAVYNRVVGELDELWASEDSEWIPGQVAAERSGYSEDHLRRLARQGQVVAEKRGRGWRYLSGSLPARTRRSSGMVEFDPTSAATKSLNKNKLDSNMEEEQCR